jgi:hypothetical protein
MTIDELLESTKARRYCPHAVLDVELHGMDIRPLPVETN